MKFKVGDIVRDNEMWNKPIGIVISIEPGNIRVEFNGQEDIISYGSRWSEDDIQILTPLEREML